MSAGSSSRSAGKPRVCASFRARSDSTRTSSESVATWTLGSAGTPVKGPPRSASDEGDAMKAGMWAIALTLLLAPAAAAQQRPAVAPPSGHLERAQAEFQAGRYAEALEEARRAADSAPTSVRALTARASMAEFLGEFNEARTFYDRAVALAPDDPGG